MTKEELKKEAKEKAKELSEKQTLGIYDNEEDLKYDEGYNSGEVAGYEKGYLAGAEPREKRIEELEKKIKKIRDYLAYKIPRELMNDATNKIWNMV